MEETGANLTTTLNPPFLVQTNSSYDPRTTGSFRTGFADVYTSGITLDMPWPPGMTVHRSKAAPGDLNLRPKTAQRVNATSLSVGYVGQKGRHSVAPVEAHQPLPCSGPLSTWTDLNTRRPLYNIFPDVGNIARTESNWTMDYNSLQAVARRPFQLVSSCSPHTPLARL